MRGSRKTENHNLESILFKRMSVIEEGKKYIVIWIY